MKLKITFALVVAFLISTTAFAAFSDVSSSHINSEAIDYVESLDIVEGYNDGTYRPDTPINRVEFTKIIIASEYSQATIDGCNTSSFSDVGDGAWYMPYVCVAELNEIVDGYPDGTYQPPNNITFAEAAKIITNTLIEPTTEGADIWYKPYVKKLEDRGAIPTTIEDFSHKLTRGEMAEIIWRLKENIRTLDSRTYNELEDVLENGGTHANAVSFELDMTNYEFSETEIRVNQGDEVTITLNSVVGTHNFTIDEYDVESLTITSGQDTEFTFTATKTGTFEYYCSVNDHRSLGMVGTLIVE
ncbi:S-layer homology domain-containing protein [Patescibacteria group bacterium]